MITASINYKFGGKVPVEFWVLQGIAFKDIPKTEKEDKQLPKEAVVRLLGYISEDAFILGMEPTSNVSPKVALAETDGTIEDMVVKAIQKSKDFEGLTVTINK